MNVKYTPHHREHAEGHIYIDKPGACTIQLTGAAAMSQDELDQYGRIAAEAIARNGIHLASAKSDAADAALHFIDELTERLEHITGLSHNLYDYPGGDRYHHERHTDRTYTLLEAAQLMEELSDHVETDSGLWEGLKPQEAVIVQAAYTYSNAVLSYFADLVDRLHERVADLANDLDEWPDAETLRNLVQAECNLFAAGH